MWFIHGCIFLMTQLEMVGFCMPSIKSGVAIVFPRLSASGVCFLQFCFSYGLLLASMYLCWYSNHVDLVSWHSQYCGDFTWHGSPALPFTVGMEVSLQFGRMLNSRTINEWLPLLWTAVVTAVDGKIIIGAPTTSVAMDTDPDGVCYMCVICTGESMCALVHVHLFMCF